MKHPEGLLESFLMAVSDNHHIHPAHISLYVTLLYYWKLQHCTNPVDVRRDELMRVSKITGRATYQRSLRDLHQEGYIVYEPRYNRFVNSRIYLNTLK